MALSKAVWKRLETQGFVCNAPAFARIEPWLRFNPSMFTVPIQLLRCCFPDLPASTIDPLLLFTLKIVPF